MTVSYMIKQPCAVKISRRINYLHNDNSACESRIQQKRE